MYRQASLCLIGFDDQKHEVREREIMSAPSSGPGPRFPSVLLDCTPNTTHMGEKKR